MAIKAPSAKRPRRSTGSRTNGKAVPPNLESDDTAVDDGGQRYPPYYHENFKIILEDVLSGVDGRLLLLQQEKDLVQSFFSLAGIILYYNRV